MAYHQLTIISSLKFRSHLLQKLHEFECIGSIDQGDRIIAYFKYDTPMQPVLEELQMIKLVLAASECDAPMTFTHAVIPDADWNESWKIGFKPVAVGERFTILPPWERHSGHRIPLIIDPGMAFGTGHHETTRSCLVLMEQYVAAVTKDRFLDLGTGTGLLAIAALKLGFQEVMGIDTDPLAIEASERNASLNQAESIQWYEGDIGFAEGVFDMIAANLISGTLITISTEIAARLKPGGVVIMSGILKGQDDEVVAAAENAGLRCIERLRDGKWVSLACRR